MQRFFSRKLPVLLCLFALILAAFWGIGRMLSPNRVSLPVLMYHHIAEEVPNDMTVSPARFEEQIAALTQDGWHAVSIAQLIDYVDHGTHLPDKPVLITFDDGYTSNVELAAPILERHGQHAVIFVIGLNAGQELYPHTGQPLSPSRFAPEDAIPYLNSGTLELQSHTYDLHQLASYGISGRDGVLPLPDEPEDDYRRTLLLDAQTQQALFSQHLNIKLTALAYPFGFWSELSESVANEAGLRVTLTTQPGSNRIQKHKPETLRLLNRYTITEQTTPRELLWLLAQH